MPTFTQLQDNTVRLLLIISSFFKQVEMNISESLSSMFLLLIESLYKPEVVMTESVGNLLVLMRLAHVYDAESTLKTCQK